MRWRTEQGRHNVPPHLLVAVTSHLPPFVWPELENQPHFLSSPEPQVEFFGIGHGRIRILWNRSNSKIGRWTSPSNICEPLGSAQYSTGSVISRDFPRARLQSSTCLRSPRVESSGE
jgi:hypothetical protein